MRLIPYICIYLSIFSAHAQEIRLIKRESVPFTSPSFSSPKDKGGALAKDTKVWVIKRSGEWLQFRVTPKNVGWSGWLKESMTYPQKVSEAKACEQAHQLLSKAFKASGNNALKASQAASVAYEGVRNLNSCKYIRYSLRTLKKPYEGDSVTPKEWADAMRNFMAKKEF